METTLVLLDLSLRAATMGAAVLLALILLLRHPRPRGTWALALLGTTLCAYLLISALADLGLPPPAAHLLIAAASAVPFALTWVVVELLAPQATGRRWILILAFLIIPVALATRHWPTLGILRGTIGLALYVGILWIALRADRDDLVPGRRLMRRVCLALMGLIGVVITIVEILGLDANLAPPFYLMQATALLLLTLGFGAYALSPQSDLWAGKPPAEVKPTGQAHRVEALMQTGIWQREGLSVAMMASELALPEHRLRQIINQDLGQRNFSSFVNAARIDAACKILADPANARRTVLEIAYEVGFASLGPFNRAFRAQTGQTPTAYRTQMLIDST